MSKMNELPVETNMSSNGWTLGEKPRKVLADAHEAAKALKEVIDSKPKKIIIGGKEYLEMPDLQTLGKFYSIMARPEEPKYVEINGTKGFSCYAVAVHIPTNQIVSAGTGYCLQDQPNWKKRPLADMAAMSQTKAVARALRNALSWVVVLAGFAPTNAEEMENMRELEGVNGNGPMPPPPPPAEIPAPMKKPFDPSQYDASTDNRPISDPQRKHLFTLLAMSGKSEEAMRQYLESTWHINETRLILRSQYADICSWIVSKNDDDDWELNEPGAEG